MEVDDEAVVEGDGLAARSAARDGDRGAVGAGCYRQADRAEPGTAHPASEGAAQFQSQPGQSELQFEVNHIGALAGQQLAVYVAGAKIATVKVGRHGVAELGLNSERGQRVPQVGAGTTIKVETTRGVTVASGSF